MTASQSRLLLIDGHSMAYRAFFALPAEKFATDDGQVTNAVYGFASMLINLLKAEEPTHIAVAFDVSRHSFRTDEYAAYKDGRGETPDDFKSQVPIIQQLLDAFGIKWLTKANFEADDIIATLATRAEAAGMSTLISSGDRDALQLVNEGHHAALPRQGRHRAGPLHARRRRSQVRRHPRPLPRPRGPRRGEGRQPPRRPRSRPQDRREVGRQIRLPRRPGRQGR